MGPTYVALMDLRRSVQPPRKGSLPLGAGKMRNTHSLVIFVLFCTRGTKEKSRTNLIDPAKTIISALVGKACTSDDGNAYSAYTWQRTRIRLILFRVCRYMENITADHLTLCTGISDN